jgi:hypothetical protein
MEVENKDWIPETYRADPSFKDFKDLDSVFKTYKEQESYLGSRIKLPNEDNDEEYGKFIEKVRPKSADEYGIEAADETSKELVQALHDTGLTKRQAKTLVEKLKGVNSKGLEASAAKDIAYKQKAFEELVKDYGDEEKATEGVKEIKQFLEKTVGEKYPDFLDFFETATIKVGDEELALANHPAMARALKVMVDMTKDDNKDIKGEPAKAEDIRGQWFNALEKMNQYPNNHDQAYKDLQKEAIRLQTLLSKLEQ